MNLKIISADHSGSTVKFRAIVGDHDAHAFTFQINSIFSDRGAGEELICNEGKSPQDFLRGMSNELDCISEGDYHNVFYVNKMGEQKIDYMGEYLIQPIYKIYCEYDPDDIPVDDKIIEPADSFYLEKTFTSQFTEDELELDKWIEKMK